MKLKPCPFCDGAPEIIHLAQRTIEIKCTSCWVSMKAKYLRLTWEELLHIMAKNWNTRKGIVNE